MFSKEHFQSIIAAALESYTDPTKVVYLPSKDFNELIDSIETEGKRITIDRTKDFMFEGWRVVEDRRAVVSSPGAKVSFGFKSK